MGSGIAINLAQHGLDVTLFDSSAEQVARALQFTDDFFARAVERGRLESFVAQAARARISSVATLAELRYANLVIEAVFEEYELKAKLFEELSAVLESDTLVATNTSCLRVGDLQRHMQAPERFLGLHYFSPAAINPIVEVVKGEATSDATIALGIAFCRETGKYPIRCRDSYGFAINRFFCPYTNEAARLLDEGAGGTADIDALASEAVGAAAGPFQVMNLIKPRINLHAIRNLAPLGPFYAPAASMVETGEADRNWPLEERAPLDAGARRLIIERFRMGAFLPVLQALDEQVATADDIDLGAREALRFSKPPCGLMDELGRSEVERIVAPALRAYGVKRPDALDRVGKLCA
jgi:3-hydroxybutyryl-CoA dehydrogenase